MMTIIRKKQKDGSRLSKKDITPPFYITVAERKKMIGEVKNIDGDKKAKGNNKIIKGDIRMMISKISKAKHPIFNLENITSIRLEYIEHGFDDNAILFKYFILYKPPTNNDIEDINTYSFQGVLCGYANGGWFEPTCYDGFKTNGRGGIINLNFDYKSFKKIFIFRNPRRIISDKKIEDLSIVKDILITVHKRILSSFLKNIDDHYVSNDENVTSLTINEDGHVFFRSEKAKNDINIFIENVVAGLKNEFIPASREAFLYPSVVNHNTKYAGLNFTIWSDDTDNLPFEISFLDGVGMTDSHGDPFLINDGTFTEELEKVNKKGVAFNAFPQLELPTRNLSIIFYICQQICKKLGLRLIASYDEFKIYV